MEGVEVGGNRLPDEASDDVGGVKEDETDPKEVSTDVSGDVNLVLGTELNIVLESGTLSDDDDVMIVGWSELVRIDVVVLSMTGPLLSGSGSETVNCSLDDPIAVFTLVLSDFGAVGESAVLPMAKVAVLVDVVSWPPDTADVTTTGAPPDELCDMDEGSTPLSILVDTIVIIVTSPPGRVLLMVVKTLEVVSETEPETCLDVVPLDTVIEPLARVEGLPVSVDVGVISTIEDCGEPEPIDVPGEVPLIVIAMLVEVVICPPGAILVVIPTVLLDNIAEPPAVGPEGEEIAPSGVLAN